MSSASATPPGEPARTSAGQQRLLERLVGVRSSKPTYYSAWRSKSDRLERSIDTLKEISAALCTTTEGPVALCEAVVEAAAHHFSARWAAMAFAGDALDEELPPLIVRYSSGRVARSWASAPPELSPLTARPEGETDAVIGGQDRGAVGARMFLAGDLFGTLAVGLPEAPELDESDLSILGTLANQAAVAVHIAWLFQEGERFRTQAEDHAGALEHRSGQLERARRGLEEARRQQLLSQERGRIARELHDSVSQHIVGIGMSLEWCGRHLPAASPVSDHIAIAKELARSALVQVRSVIFELSPPGEPGGLSRALRDLVDELRSTTDLEIVMRTRGAQRWLAPTTAHALLQIAREALFNIARHADAGRAWVTLRYGDRGLKLAVADDSNGDPRLLQRRLDRAAADGSHRGLLDMAERVRELGAEARFAPRRGGGVRLEVTVRLQDLEG
ncbi:MAG: histidine kinase [Acidimicrobiales bacterium]